MFQMGFGTQVKSICNQVCAAILCRTHTLVAHACSLLLTTTHTRKLPRTTIVWTCSHSNFLIRLLALKLPRTTLHALASIHGYSLSLVGHARTSLNTRLLTLTHHSARTSFNTQLHTLACPARSLSLEPHGRSPDKSNYIFYSKNFLLSMYGEDDLRHFITNSSILIYSKRVCASGRCAQTDRLFCFQPHSRSVHSALRL
jgi:hypothetical protein